MYKLLPILLFAFVFPNSSEYEQDILLYIDHTRNEIYKDVNIFLDKNKVIIDVEIEIEDTITCKECKIDDYDDFDNTIAPILNSLEQQYIGRYPVHIPFTPIILILKTLN